MNLPVLRKENFGLKSLFDQDSLFDRMFDDFSSIFGANCYTDKSGDVIYQLEVPGFNKDNLDVELSEGVLTITGDREVKDKNYAGAAKLYKRLTVGMDVKDATAEVKDGILTVTLQQPEIEPGKKIEIK